jgi:hypothetical protein
MGFVELSANVGEVADVVGLPAALMASLSATPVGDADEADLRLRSGGR